MAAANTTFIIYDTAGNAVTAIQPNTLDGPGGVQQSSDLELYGLGFPNWGAGADQNDYRLAENFACPSLAAYPSSARYAKIGATLAATTPASGAADELGTTNGAPNGINVPVVGQLWFNITQQELYIYTEIAANTFSWQLVATHPVATGSTAPTNPYLAQLWYDPSVPQLKVWNGTAWASVAALYLPLTGGTMTGTITFDAVHTITNLPDPTAASPGSQVATKNYVQTQVAGVSGFVQKTGDTMTGALTMSNAGINLQNGTFSLTGSSGISISSNGTLTFGGNRLQNIGYPAVNSDAARVDWVLNNFLPLSGGTLSGTLNLNNHSLINIPTPFNPGDAANKAYVDSKFSQSVTATPMPTNGGGVGQIITVLQSSNSVPYVYTFPAGGTWFYQFYVFAYYESGNWWLAPMGGVFSGVAAGGTSIDLYPQMTHFNGNTQFGYFTGNGVQVMGTIWRMT